MLCHYFPRSEAPWSDDLTDLLASTHPYQELKRWLGLAVLRVEGAGARVNGYYACTAELPGGDSLLDDVPIEYDASYGTYTMLSNRGLHLVYVADDPAGWDMVDDMMGLYHAPADGDARLPPSGGWETGYAGPPTPRLSVLRRCHVAAE